MYSLRNILLQEPSTISAVVVAILNVFVLVGWLALSDKAVIGIDTAAVLVLNLFYVRPLTASKSGLQELAEANVLSSEVISSGTEDIDPFGGSPTP
jgi:hypothetical protein